MVILSAAKDLAGSRRPSPSAQILQSLSLHQDDMPLRGESAPQRAVIPGAAHFSCDPFLRLGIGYEFLLGRIPLQFAAQAHRDRAEVAHGCGAVADLGGADRFLAALYALEEIAHVIVAEVEAFVRIAELVLEEFPVAGGE